MKLLRMPLLFVAVMISAASPAAEVTPTAKLQIETVGIPRMATPYWENSSREMTPRGPHAVLWWLDDRPRELRVWYQQPQVPPGEPAPEGDVRAALEALEIHVLPAAMREQFRGKDDWQVAQMLASLTTPPRLEIRWTVISRIVSSNSRGEMSFDVFLRQDPETPVPPGEYVVLARVPLPPDSKLGALSQVRHGLVTYPNPARLVVRPSESLFERAYVEYVHAEDLLHLHELYKYDPRYADVPDSVKAAELDEALEAARRLVALDPSSATAHEEVCAVHYARREAAPALAACRKAAELRAAGTPDLAKEARPTGDGGWDATTTPWRRITPLEARIHELSQPEPKFSKTP